MSRRRKLRFHSQVELADCGAACLAMVLDYYGKRVPLEQVRDLTGVGRDGVTALAVIEAASFYGLRGRGVRAEPDDLRELPTGTLLYWEMSHFVVLDQAGRRGIEVIDPALGRRTVTWAEVDESFTGVAILLEPGANFAPGGSRQAGVRRFLRPLLAQRSTLSRILVTSLVLRLLALALPLLTAVLVDRVVPYHDPKLLQVLGVCLGAVVAYTFLGSWLRSRLLLELRTVVDAEMTLSFLDHLLGLPVVFHLRRSSGDLLARLRSNAIVREILTTSTLATLFDGTFAALYLGVLFAVSPAIAQVVLVLGALQVLILLGARQRLEQTVAEGLKAESASQGYAIEMLYGVATLKASGTEHRAIEKFGNLFTEELRTSIARGRLTALVEAASGALNVASPLVVLSYAGWLVLGGSLHLGGALAANALAVGFLTPLGSMMSAGITTASLRGYLGRLNDIFDSPLEQEGVAVRPAPPLRGGISAEQVSFRYSPLSPHVVHGVSLDIEPGQTVALVGRSGSGKTTLANLLVGLYEPTDGRICHDGLDLAGLDLRTVRAQLGIVTQEPYLFAGTIRENIAFAEPDASEDDVRRAARLACLDQDIERLPMGYETPLGEAGTSLSGGQRQRLALARALVGRPRVLLLDEATSHLDALTEAGVHDNLREHECTVVIVAHRLSTVTGADVIAVVEDGRIVERGTHDELLAAGGAYHRLVTGQMASSPPARSPLDLAVPVPATEFPDPLPLEPPMPRWLRTGDPADAPPPAVVRLAALPPLPALAVVRSADAEAV